MLDFLSLWPNTYQLVRLYNLIWAGWTAMDSHELEPNLNDLDNDSVVNLVFEIVLYTSSRTLCRTKCKHQLFAVDHVFTNVGSTLTVLRAKLHHGQNGVVLKWDDDTRWMIHEPPNTSGLFRVVEVCSGIGIMGKGFERTGAVTQCYVDHNAEYVRWLKAHSVTPVVEGDICSCDTVFEISKHVSKTHTLAGGFSCQPFSSLGDQLQEQDPRSSSFWGVLTAGHYLQSLVIILECTKEAATAECIQSGLKSFAESTGYRVVQQTLDLHSTWPARRTRWWAAVVHPLIDMDQIRPLPKLLFAPGIMHVVPKPMTLPQDQLEQLQLDLYELRNFYEDRKGITHNMTDFCKPLPTATHSWGSQVKACFCGCRSSGFNPQRIFEKGLYGQLIQLDSTSKLGQHTVNDARHLHPQEVAILNGLLPSHVTPSPDFHARLELSGVGQMASPIQSLWVLAQVQFQASQQDIFPPVPEPEEVLACLCKQLLVERDSMWPNKTIYMEKFEDALNALHAKVDFSQPTSDAGSLTQEILQAVNVQDLPPISQPDESDACQDPYQVEPSSDSDTPDTYVHAQLRNWIKSEDSHDTDAESDILDNKSDLLSDEHPVPPVSPPMNVTDFVHADPGSAPDTPGPSHTPGFKRDCNNSESVQNSTDEINDTSHEAGGPKRQKCHHGNETSQFAQGAVPGFASVSSPPMSLQIPVHADPDSATGTAGPSQPHVEVVPRPDDSSTKLQEHPKSIECQVPLTESPKSSPAKIMHEAPEVIAAKVRQFQIDATKDRTLPSPTGIFVVVKDEPILTVQFVPKCTVGQLALATDAVLQMKEPIKVTSAVGSQLPLSSHLQPGSFVRFQEVGDASKWQCGGIHDTRPVPSLVAKDRATLLWQQEGWVATDEMKFYDPNCTPWSLLCHDWCSSWPWLPCCFHWHYHENDPAFERWWLCCSCTGSVVSTPLVPSFHHDRRPGSVVDNPWWSNTWSDSAFKTRLVTLMPSPWERPRSHMHSQPTVGFKHWDGYCQRSLTMTRAHHGPTIKLVNGEAFSISIWSLATLIRLLFRSLWSLEVWVLWHSSKSCWSPMVFMRHEAWSVLSLCVRPLGRHPSKVSSSLPSHGLT